MAAGAGLCLNSTGRSTSVVGRFAARGCLQELGGRKAGENVFDCGVFWGVIMRELKLHSTFRFS